MFETFVFYAANVASFLLSMLATVGLLTAVGIALAWVMERNSPCNPYAVFPCPCPSNKADQNDNA